MSSPSPTKVPPKSEVPRTTQRALPYVIALLLTPVLVLWRHDDALYNPLWYADAWFYLGYFRDLVSFKRDLFPGFYYGSRLSWILPGYAAHKLLSPLAANAVLHLGTLLISVFSIYYTVRATLGLRVAYLAAMMFALHPWLWAGTGWDYTSSGVIAYYCLAVALVTGASASGKRWLLLPAGMAMAGAVIAQLYIVSFLPLVLVQYAALERDRRQRPLLESLRSFVVWAGAGVVSFTAPICVINGLWVDGNFWFWTPSLLTAQRVTSNYTWTESLFDGKHLDPYLWVIFAASGVALLLLPAAWKMASEKRNSAPLVFSLQLMLPTAWMLVLQGRGITLLGHYYYSCYLVPGVFLTLGGLLWPAVDRLTLRQWQLACAVATLLFGSIWISPGANTFWFGILPDWLAFLLACCLLLTALPYREKAIGLGLAAAGLFMLTSLSYNGTHRDVNIHATRQEYQRVMDNRRIVEQDRHGESARFWYDRDEPAFHEYFALNASYMAEFARIGEHFPNDCAGTAERGDLAVVTSSKQQTPELARRALASCWQTAGVQPSIRTVQQVDRPGQPYTLVVLTAVDDLTIRRPMRVEFDPAGRGTLALVPNPKESLSLPLDRWVPSSGASLQRDADQFVARTPPGGTAYAFTYAPLVVPETATYRFELKYRVIEGQIAFGAFPADQTRWLANDLFGRTIREGRMMQFTVPLNAGDVVLPRIANSNKGQTASTFVFLYTSITALAPPR